MTKDLPVYKITIDSEYSDGQELGIEQMEKENGEDPILQQQAEQQDAEQEMQQQQSQLQQRKADMEQV